MKIALLRIDKKKTSYGVPLSILPVVPSNSSARITAFIISIAFYSKIYYSKLQPILKLKILA